MLTPEQAAKVAARIEVLQSEIADREEAVVNMKATLAESEGVGEHVIGTPDFGYRKVIVYQSKQFNEAFLKKQSPELWEKAAVTKQVVTSATAKAALTEEEYAVGQKPSDGLSVKIESLSDPE